MVTGRGGGGCYRAIPAMWFRDRYTDDLYSNQAPNGLWILSKLDLRLGVKFGTFQMSQSHGSFRFQVQIWTICIKLFCFLNAVICGQQTLNKVNHNGSWWRQDQIMSSAHSMWERCIKWSFDQDPFLHFFLLHEILYWFKERNH